MICCIFVFLLLCSTCVYSTKYENCSAQKCLKCESQEEIYCSEIPLDSNYTMYNFYCTVPSACYYVQVNGEARFCFLIVSKLTNDSLVILADSFVFREARDTCETAHSQPLHQNCLGLYYETSTRESIGLSPISCSYYMHNSNNKIIINALVNVTNETDIYSDYFVMSSTTAISSSLIATSPTNTTVHAITTQLDTGRTDATIHESIFVIIAALSVAIIFLLFVFFISILGCYCYKQSSKNKNLTNVQHQTSYVSTEPEPTVEFQETTDQYSEELPLLLIQTIGSGKFGSVWKTIYNNETVAVKFFSHRHKSLWKNEEYINTLGSTPHENILPFIDSGIKGTGYNSQFFIITQYYPLGSLNQYLCHNVLSWEQALNLMYSVSRGLSHLHSTSYTNSDGVVLEKYAIAHRDVKSSNIFVKDESGKCLLGDMGLALILDPTSDDRHLANSGQVGTYRYMAPEALDARVNLHDIESFKQIDAYALAFVLWEICTRCKLDEVPIDPYQPPLFDVVGEKPTLEQMRDVVVVAKYRPTLLESWKHHKNMQILLSLMMESWDEDPEARLTAANITEQLYKLSTMSHDNSPSPAEQHKRTYVSASFSGSSNIPSCAIPLRFSEGNINLPLLRKNFERAILSNVSMESGIFESDTDAEHT